MPTRRTNPGPVIAAPPPRIKKFEDEIGEAVEQRMRSRLGITANRKLPAEVDALIKSAAATAAGSTLETAVVRDVTEATNDLVRGSVLDRFDIKVADARVGLDHIAGSNDVEKF